MVVIFGTKWFGKINVVPGLFCVATKFGHINYLPLIPMESAIVIENSSHKTEKGENVILAVPIPFSWKSYFTAVWRSILWIGLFAAALYLLFTLIEPNMLKEHRADSLSELTPVTGSVLAILAICLLLYWSHRASIAIRERAVELGQLAGFGEQLVLEQLAFDGYPLRKPARAFGMRNCPSCGALNRGMSMDDGSMICGRCGTVIARKK